MLPIIASWVYIVIVTYLLGSLVISLMKKSFRLPEEISIHFSIICIAGMAVATFIATVFSLFMKVGIVANIAIAALAFSYALLNRKNLLSHWKKQYREAKQSPLLFKLIFFLFLLAMAYIAALPTSHYDNGLYYSQSIKWLQEYGTVPGLGNIHFRLAFNSSWLVLQSLFAFPFLVHKPLINLNGLLYMLVFIYWLQGLMALWRNDRSFFTFLKAFFFVPVLALHFTITHDFAIYHTSVFNCPSADVPGSFIMWIIFLLFLEKTKDGSVTTLKDLLIILLSCFMVTIKLSTAPILLLALYCGWKIFTRYKRMLTFLLGITCILFMAPWMVRNVLISGYLAFPFSAIDLFNVDWKIPSDRVDYYTNEIRIWAINPEFDLSKPPPVPFFEWVSGWFKRQSYIHSLLIITTLLSSISLAIYLIWQTLRKGWGFMITNERPAVYLLVSVAGTIFWFMKAPDPRFGFGLLVFSMVFGIAAFFKFFIDTYSKTLSIIIYMIAVSIFVSFYSSVITNSPFKKLLAPLPDFKYPGKLDTIALSPTINIYLSKEDRCYDCELPCTPRNAYIFLTPVPRGKTIRDGFRPLSNHP